jgi:transketolase
VAANLEGTSASEVDREGYITSDNSGKNFPDIILIGTGSELFLCEGSPKKVRKEGRKIRVVPLVCWQLFNRQWVGGIMQEEKVLLWVWMCLGLGERIAWFY